MRGLLLICFLAVLAGCSIDREATPSGIPADSIIPESRMVLLLADAHTIEAALLIARNRGTSTTKLTAYYYAGLYRKYGISRERYQQNLAYYRDDPETFLRLYEKVNQELVKREKDFVKQSEN